jgi:hypothetical protein
MKPLIFLAAFSLLSCTKQNQGLHASLSITGTPGNYIISPNASTGPITSWEVRLYYMPSYGTGFQLWGPYTWGAGTTIGTNAYIYEKATLIVKDNAGHSDSTVVNQEF